MASCIRRSWLFLFSLMVTVVYFEFIFEIRNTKVKPDLEIGDPEYLVDSSKCKILNVVPWNSEFNVFYEEKKYISCTGRRLLTTIEYTESGPVLVIDQHAVPLYTRHDVSCCYRRVQRGVGDAADTEIRYSACQNFRQRTLVKTTELTVECRDSTTNRTLYNNAHSIVYKSATIKKKMAAYRNKRKPPSVLLIGIDSVSRLNFHRMFPKTNQRLGAEGWLEYLGYNKVDDNTFPNLMALLTGKNETLSYSECNPRKTGVLDTCNFLWKNYSDHNYVTTYVEDTQDISTFTFLKKGFLNPPTDLYYKPYMMAAEDLGIYHVDNMAYCSGPESSAERILRICKDFVEQIGDYPKFGLFWMNGFSHDDVNAPARMDQVIANFFESLQPHLVNTIVLFFSDHGMRFGDIRLSTTGWYEERLPFVYFWIPTVFRKEFPIEYATFKENSFRLTTAYDIHMTFQNVLEMFNLSTTHLQSVSCKMCKSLFRNVGDRSCDDVNIADHWCTCFGYKPLDSNSEQVVGAGEFAVNELNRITTKYASTKRNCAKFKMDDVILAQISNSLNTTLILVMFRTVPRAIFEFTVSVNRNQAKEITYETEGGISRLDKYGPTSHCVEEHKMYCFCRWNQEMETKNVNFWFEV